MYFQEQIQQIRNSFKYILSIRSAESVTTSGLRPPPWHSLILVIAAPARTCQSINSRERDTLSRTQRSSSSWELHDCGLHGVLRQTLRGADMRRGNGASTQSLAHQSLELVLAAKIQAKKESSVPPSPPLARALYRTLVALSAARQTWLVSYPSSTACDSRCPLEAISYIIT